MSCYILPCHEKRDLGRSWSWQVFKLFDTDDSGKMDVTEMVDVCSAQSACATSFGARLVRRTVSWCETDVFLVQVNTDRTVADWPNKQGRIRMMLRRRQQQQKQKQ